MFNKTDLDVWMTLNERNMIGDPVRWRSADLLWALRRTRAIHSIRRSLRRLEAAGQVQRTGSDARQDGEDRVFANPDGLWLVTPHEREAGDRCVEGPDGLCQLCRVEMTRCPDCGGRGYHRTGCPAV